MPSSSQPIIATHRHVVAVMILMRFIEAVMGTVKDRGPGAGAGGGGEPLCGHGEGVEADPEAGGWPATQASLPSLGEAGGAALGAGAREHRLAEGGGGEVSLLVGGEGGQVTQGRLVGGGAGEVSVLRQGVTVKGVVEVASLPLVASQGPHSGSRGLRRRWALFALPTLAQQGQQQDGEEEQKQRRQA